MQDREQLTLIYQPGCSSLASGLIGVLVAIATVFIWPAAVFADSPAPALVTIKGNFADLQAVHNRIEQAGGHVEHIFPPDVFIARLTTTQAGQIRTLSQVDSVTFDPVPSLSGLDTSPSQNIGVAIWNSVFHSPQSIDVMRATEPFTDETLIAPDLPPETDLSMIDKELGIAGLPYGAGYYDTSKYMVGDVVVAVVMPESNGQAEPSTQNWTATEVAKVQSTTVAGMDKWVQAEPNANLTFIYVWADAPPTGGISYTVEADYEAELHSNFSSDVINSFMEKLGYTSGGSFTNIRDYINDLRDTYEADWAYLVQARDDSSGCGRASAFIFGPATTIYDCDLRSGFVVAHESGHIFGATDEYCPDACRSPISRHGYLQGVNANSQGPSGSHGPGYFDGKGEALSNIMRNTTFKIGPYTRGQIGWRDSDGDGTLDVRDTFPNTTLLTPTLDTTIHISGQVTVVPLPGSGNDISLNAITGVDIRLDGLTWLPATAGDGTFDDPEETYNLTLPLLPNGSYTVEARGHNDVGNTERSYAHTSFSITGSPVINARPFAAFQITPPIGSTATTFTVDANPSTDLEGHTLLARWDWENDGTWDTAWSPTLNTSHNYTGPGSKIIALELKDNLGATTKVTRSVEVGSPNTPPVPFFRVENGDSRFATTTPTFNFDATGSKDAETPTADLEYRWDFDGNGSWDFGWGSINKQAVTFSLNDQGKGDNLPRSNHWATKLQVRDSNGAVGETTRHIWANPYNHPPVSTGFLSDTVAHTAASLPLDFSLTSDIDIDETWDALLEYRFDWDSDGNWDTDFQQAGSWSTYNHPVAGDYAITMQAQDRYGATSRQISRPLTILTPPVFLTGSGLEATAFVDQTANQTLIITNSGEYSLTFNLTEVPLGVPLTYTVSDNVSGPLTFDWVSSWPGAYYPTAGDWTATNPDQSDIPWLTLSTLADTTAGEDTTAIGASFDAQDLSPGTYTGQLIIHSNDPDTSFASLPVTFHVQALPIIYDKTYLPVIGKHSSTGITSNIFR